MPTPGSMVEFRGETLLKRDVVERFVALRPDLLRTSRAMAEIRRILKDEYGIEVSKPVIQKALHRLRAAQGVVTPKMPKPGAKKAGRPKAAPPPGDNGLVSVNVCALHGATLTLSLSEAEAWDVMRALAEALPLPGKTKLAAPTVRLLHLLESAHKPPIGDES